MDRYQQGKKISVLTIVGNVILAVIKIGIGLFSGSSALIADGFHSLSDIVSTIAVIIAINISHQPPDENHPYGHGNAEPIAAKILGIILLFTGAFLAINSGREIIGQDYHILGLLPFWTAVISIIIKEYMFRYTYKIGRETSNQALIADAWHHRSDAVSSIAAAIGVMGSYLGYPILDPIAGLIVSAMVIKVGWDITRDAVISLMVTSPPEEKLDLIEELARQIEGVEQVVDIKAHYNGVDLYIDLKILVDYRMSVLEGHQVASEVKREITDVNGEVKEVLIHVDPMLPG